MLQRPAHPAVEALKVIDVFEKATSLRSQVLACAACQVARCQEKGIEPRFFGRAIVRCTGALSGSLVPIMRTLIEADAVEPVSTHVGRGQNRIYCYPVSSGAGSTLMDNLTPPAQCGLESVVDDVDAYLFGKVQE